MPELHDPVPHDRARALRGVVLAHAMGERRRRHLPLVHVRGSDGTTWAVPALPAGSTGSPGPGKSGRPGDPGDHALRTDVLAALFRRTTGGDPGRPAHGAEVLVWLTRPGELELQDVDVAWLAAAMSAAAEAELDLTMVVVNRHGWRDPRTGTEVMWKRLRKR